MMGSTGCRRHDYAVLSEEEGRWRAELRVRGEGSVCVGELLRVEVRVFSHSSLNICFDLRGKKVSMVTWWLMTNGYQRTLQVEVAWSDQRVAPSGFSYLVWICFLQLLGFQVFLQLFGWGNGLHPRRPRCLAHSVREGQQVLTTLPCLKTNTSLTGGRDDSTPMKKPGPSCSLPFCV